VIPYLDMCGDKTVASRETPQAQWQPYRNLLATKSQCRVGIPGTLCTRVCAQNAKVGLKIRLPERS